jgi:hypothetical protein
MGLILTSIWWIGVIVVAHWVIKKLFYKDQPTVTKTIIREVKAAEDKDDADWWKGE